MKKLFLLPILFYISVFMGFAQEFSFPLYFEDALGNKDTVILGYSPNASNGLDTELGEIDISNTEIDTNFAAYVTNVIIEYLGNTNFYIPDYKTKKQIIHNSESGKAGIGQLGIDLICKHFPITISWDKTLFEDTTRSHSLVVITPPGWWFDVGEDPILFDTKDTVVYQKKDFDSNTNFYYDSISNEKIKIWQIYVIFISKNNLSNNIHENVKYNIYPNICNNVLYIDFGIEKSVTIQLLNMAGIPVYRNHVSAPATSIDMSEYPPGAYVVRIQEGEQVFSRIIVKK